MGDAPDREKGPRITPALREEAMGRVKAVAGDLIDEEAAGELALALLGVAIKDLSLAELKDGDMGSLSGTVKDVRCFARKDGKGEVMSIMLSEGRSTVKVPIFQQDLIARLKEEIGSNSRLTIKVGRARERGYGLEFVPQDGDAVSVSDPLIDNAGGDDGGATAPTGEPIPGERFDLEGSVFSLDGYRTFERDGRRGSLLKIQVYDGNELHHVVLWGEAAEMWNGELDIGDQLRMTELGLRGEEYHTGSTSIVERTEDGA